MALCCLLDKYFTILAMPWALPTLVVFWVGPHACCPGLTLDGNSLTFASCIAGIIDVSYSAQLVF
jgi:hypothetical protein